MNKKLLTAALLSLSCFFSYAEEADTLKIIDIEEVTIIATPKETRKLREQPAAVTLLSQENMQNSHVNNIKNLTSIVPNLFIPDYGSKLTSAIYIRGIGSRINTSSVGLYVDNIAYIDKSAFDFNYADIERIDILRGPQGTLYGRNAMGGVIKVHTKSPFSYQGTDIRLGAATHNSYNASLTHYHRISERFAFSAGGFYNYDGGFFENKALDDKKIDQVQSGGGRLRGIYLPTENLKLDLNVSYEYSDQGAYPYGLYDIKTANISRPSYNRESSYYRNLLNVGLNIEHQADNFILSSATGYQWLKDGMMMDQDFSASDIYTLEQRQRIHTLSEEITFKSKPGSGWEWATGLFTFYQSLNTDSPVTFRKDGVTMLNRTFGTVIPEINVPMGRDMAMHILPTLNITDTEMPIDGSFQTPQANIALFHQSTFRNLFGAKGLSLTMGLRLDYEKMKLDYNSGTTLNYDVSITGKMMSAGQVIREIAMMPTTPLTVNSRYQGSLSKDYLQLLPKLALQYEFPNNTGNLYATVSKGYRSGGYNFQNFSELLQSSLRNDMMRQTKEAIMQKVPENYAGLVSEKFPDAGENPEVKPAVDYKPEQTWNYEIGTHLNLFNKRLQMDASLFWMETKNQQISRFAATGLGRETVNAGKSRSQGAELSVIAFITDAFTLNASYGYTLAKFRDYYVGSENNSEKDAIDYKNNYVPFVPKHTLNIGGLYTFTLNKPALDRIQLSLNYNAAGRLYWTEDNRVSQPFYGTLNGRLSFLKKQCEVAFWVRNILDEDYTAFYFESMNIPLAQQGRPIQGGIEVRLRF